MFKAYLSMFILFHHKSYTIEFGSYSSLGSPKNNLHLPGILGTCCQLRRNAHPQRSSHMRLLAPLRCSTTLPRTLPKKEKKRRLVLDDLRLYVFRVMLSDSQIRIYSRCLTALGLQGKVSAAVSNKIHSDW